MCGGIPGYSFDEPQLLSTDRCFALRVANANGDASNHKEASSTLDQLANNGGGSDSGLEKGDGSNL